MTFSRSCHIGSPLPPGRELGLGRRRPPDHRASRREAIAGRGDAGHLLLDRRILATDKSNPWTKTDIASESAWADALREKSPEGRAATSKWHYVKLDVDKPDLKKAVSGDQACRR